MRWLVEAAVAKGLWRRNRFSVEERVNAALAYMAGLSYREIAYVLGLVGASHEAIRQWVLRLEGLAVGVRRRRRRAVAVDETVLKLGGAWLYVWAAVDAFSREVLAIRASFQRMDLDAEAFLRIVLKTCEDKPLILVDKGPWYPNALRRLRLRWRHEAFGLRNRVERWFRTLKARTRRFSNNFPVRRWRGALERVEAWLRLFTLWYNWVRPHQTLGRPPSQEGLT